MYDYVGLLNVNAVLRVSVPDRYHHHEYLLRHH